MNNYLLFTLSIVLFCVGVLFHGGRKSLPGAVLSTLFLLYSIVFIVSDYFTGSGVDSSVFFHLRYGLDGAGFGDYLPLILLTVPAMVFVVAGPFLFFAENGCSLSKRTNGHGWIFYSAVAAAFLCSPTTSGIVDYFQFGGLNFFGATVPVDLFEEYYRQPHIVGKQEQHPNLVFIYAESLEGTYLDEDLFPGLMKNLQELR